MDFKDFFQYSIEDIEAFGSRLHINTFLSIIFNSLAAYLILKHSTPVMGIYKFYMLSTVFFAFLMDFHITFIWGWYPLFPRLAMCPAGIVKYFGPFWGVTVQYVCFSVMFGCTAALHFTLSFCGLSILSSLTYQYLSIIKGKHILKTFKGGIILGFIFIIYPLPSFLMRFPNSEGMIEDIKQNEPKLLPFFIAASCNGTSKSTHSLIYLCIVIIQIFIVLIAAFYIGFKIFKHLKLLKLQMSTATLKMRQQFLFVLVIQMFIPFMFIVVPLIFISILVILKVGNIDALNQAFIQTLTLHSVANSLTVIFFIKPYREALQKWSTNTFSWKKTHLQISPKIFETTVSYILSK